MKSIILLILITTNLNLFADWKQIKTPKTFSKLDVIKSGSDFLVACKLDPYFSFDNGETWEKRINGLPIDRSSIRILEVYEDIVFINTYAGFLTDKEYIFYTTDKGKNWHNLVKNDSIDNLNISDISIDNNSIYLLPRRITKVVKSNDWGNTWDTLPGLENKHHSMNYIRVNSDTIVLADIGSSMGEFYGIFVSVNGGQSWEKRIEGFGASEIECIKLINNSIYIGTKTGFYYSHNLGESYQVAGKIMLSRYVNDFDVKSDTIIAGTTTGLFISKDKCETWEEIERFKNHRVSRVHFSKDFLFVNSSLNNYTNDNSYFTSDYENFDIVNFQDYNDLADLEINNSHIYFSTYFSSKNGIYMVNNLDRQFDEITKDSFGLSIYSLNILDNYIIARLQPITQSGLRNQLILSSDYGETWTTKNVIESNFNIRDVLLLNKDTLLISSPNGIFISNNLGEDWAEYSVENEEINSDLKRILRFKKINNKIYFYGNGRILETDLHLSNWKSIIKEFDYSKTDSINSEYYREIIDFSLSNDNIYLTSFAGNFIEPENVDFVVSKDYGETWEKIDNKIDNKIGTDNTVWVQSILNIDDYVFVCTTTGLYLSKDNGNSWEEINEGLDALTKVGGVEFKIYGDKILFLSRGGLFYRDLEELGITLSTEKTEKRNYLWTYPPYPHPTNSILKVEIYWDSGLPFSKEDVEIYNITGLKINTNETLTLQKENKHKGQIIWDVSNQNPGIYIMKITHGTETRVRKIMVVE